MTSSTREERPDAGTLEHRPNERARSSTGVGNARCSQALRTQGHAEWHAFDWDADDWDADIVPFRSEPTRCTASPVVLLEGAYSARPELHDLLDLLVLLDTPTDVRLERLLEREGESYRSDWLGRWSAAEDHYFGTVMPRARFDLVLPARDLDGEAVTFVS